ncbi:hypothetical protein [Rhizobium sp. 16-544-2B]
MGAPLSLIEMILLAKLRQFAIGFHLLHAGIDHAGQIASLRNSEGNAGRIGRVAILLVN